MKQVVIKGVTDIPRACTWLSHWLAKGLSGGKPVTVKLSHESRSDLQNRHQWALYNCFVKSAVDWPRGSNNIPTSEQWKVLFVSAYNKDAAYMVIGLAGEIVNYNYSSRALKKAEFSELIEFIYSEGCQRGVTWDDPAMKAYEEWSK